MRRLAQSNGRMKNWMAGLCLAAVAFGQADAPRLTFEVASVKVNSSLNTNSSINDAPGGKLDCKNVSLRQLIAFAYNVRDYQILNAPAWAGSEHYDVTAKPPEEDGAKEPAQMTTGPAEERLLARTQALLADRFGLAVHNENREMPVYTLVVADSGSKLAASKENHGQMSWNSERVLCKKVTMKRFAEVLLASRLNRFVVDKTGLTGEYDFELHFAPDPAPGRAAEGTAGEPGLSFEAALQEQLGLKLTTAKAAVPYLVIDKVARLTAN